MTVAIKQAIQSLSPEDKDRMVVEDTEISTGRHYGSTRPTTYVSTELLAKLAVEGQIKPLQQQGERSYQYHLKGGASTALER